MTEVLQDELFLREVLPEILRQVQPLVLKEILPDILQEVLPLVLHEVLPDIFRHVIQEVQSDVSRATVQGGSNATNTGSRSVFYRTVLGSNTDYVGACIRTVRPGSPPYTYGHVADES